MYIHVQYVYSVCVPGGMTPSEVMKEDSALYGSPGANLVAMGDQGLQEEGGGMGAATGWGQFPNGRWSILLYTHYPLATLSVHSFAQRSPDVHTVFTCIVL